MCSCQQEDPVNETGNLTIVFRNFAFTRSARTIMPSTSSVKVARYYVSGSGPNGASFGPMIVNDDVITVEAIQKGQWNISAYAENSDGRKLVEGNTSVNVTESTNNAVINLNQYYGQGEIKINISWDAETFSYPQLFASLEDEKGHKEYLTIIDKNNAEGTAKISQNFDSGSYILSVEVKQGGTLKGAVNAVRIIDGMTSSGDIRIESDGESFEITLKDNSTEPIIGSLMATRVNARTVKLIFTPEQIPENYVIRQLDFKWFKDGNTITTGHNSTIETDYKGTKVSRYDVIVSTPLLGSTGSASCYF